MTCTKNLQLTIGNALPHGNNIQSDNIIVLWEQIQTLLDAAPFTARSAPGATLKQYRIGLDASPLLALMRKAVESSGSFDAYRRAHVDDVSLGLEATISLVVRLNEDELGETEMHGIAQVFIHQLVMAVNLLQPGGIQILNARFEGEWGYWYEAPIVDSRIYYGAQRALRENFWKQQQRLTTETVWNWLEQTGICEEHTAVRSVNKVLVTMLKVAEARHAHSARTALLVLYQLEMLLDCHNRMDSRLLRNRLLMVLQSLPEPLDCIHELYEIRHGLLAGNQPVRRPPLMSHTIFDEGREQIDPHDSAIELGTALVLLLIQDLIRRDARTFEFTETFSCQ